MARRASNNKPAKLISKPVKKVELTPQQKRKVWWITYKNIVITVSVILALLGTTVFAIVMAENKNSESTGGEYTLLDLGSSGCPACDDLKPIIDLLRTKYQGKINVNYYDVNNTTRGRELGNQYNVSSIPTLIYLDKDGKEVSRSVGFKSQAQIEAEFRRLGWI